jgi:C4-dicarboxylate-binding protein DctP
MVNLRFYPQGERVLFTNFEVDNIESLRGKKIRVMQSKVLMDTYNAWGASGVPMNVPELYTALQQGTIDGVDTTAPFAYTWKYHEVTKFLVMAPRIAIPAMFLVSKKWLDTLPADLEKAVYEAAADDEELTKRAVKFNEEALEKMEKEGINVVFPSEGLLDELRERSKIVHQNFLKDHPEAKAIYDEILQELSHN